MKFYLNRKILSGFILSVVVLLSLGIASFVFIKKVIETSRRGTSSQQIISNSEHVITQVAELEAAQLKFAITGNEKFIKDRTGDLQQIQKNLDQLNSLTENFPEQHERITKLKELVDRSTKFYKTLSEKANEPGDVTEDIRQELLTFNDEELQSEIHRLVSAIRNEERLAKTEQQAFVTGQFYQFILTFSALLIVGLLTPAILVYALNSNLKARAKAEEKLKVTLEANHDLYENAPCGYFLVDNEGMISSINETLLRWLDYSRKEVVNRIHIEQLLTDADVFTDEKSRLRTEGALAETEFYMVRKNQSKFPVVLNAVVIPGTDGKPMTIRCSLFDNTKRKMAEEETKALNSELEAFSYSVSHDLRAPLRAINGYVEILNEDFSEQLDGEAKRFLKIISNNSAKMGQLIDDLLHFSKIGKREIVVSNIEMEAIIKPIIDELTESEKNRDIKLQCQELGTAWVDVSMMRQVWINLLSNAFKYTQKREQARIEVGSHPNAEETIYYVRDNGVGFDMKYADKLFGVFQRLHRPEDFQGTGVGLALVKRIIDKHNGKIWVEAAENEGATFYFSLPKMPIQ
jgi:PAS domain S-box-containing protein